MKEWMLKVKPGDCLNPDPYWNKSERKDNQLYVPTEVLDVRTGLGSQSRVLYLVQFKGGSASWLDAGWFCKPETAPAGE